MLAIRKRKPPTRKFLFNAKKAFLWVDRPSAPRFHFHGISLWAYNLILAKFVMIPKHGIQHLWKPVILSIIYVNGFIPVLISNDSELWTHTIAICGCFHVGKISWQVALIWTYLSFPFWCTASIYVPSLHGYDKFTSVERNWISREL